MNGPAGGADEALRRAVVKAGIEKVRAALVQLESEIDFGPVERAPAVVRALPAPAPARKATPKKSAKKKRKKRKKRRAARTPKALPAPRAAGGPPRGRRGPRPGTVASPLRDSIVEVLRREEGPLTAREIAERLRSRAFSYDPGQCADAALTGRVSSCLNLYKDLFEWAGAKGMGYRLKG